MHTGHWLLVRSLLLKRRGRNALVGLVFATAALLFVTALSIRQGLDRPFEAMYQSQRGSHLVLVFDARLHPASAVAGWWRSRAGTEGVLGPLPLVHVAQPPVLRDRELDTQLWLVEHPGASLDQDVPRVVEGRGEKTGPGPGELWIPTTLAHQAGVAVGDVLGIPVPSGVAPLRVSAVVVDPQFSSPFLNPTRVWVRAGALPRMFPAGDLNAALVAVRLADRHQVDSEWDAFTRWADGAFGGIALFYATIEAAWLSLGRTLGLLLLGFSTLSLVVALFLMQATVSASIAADGRIVGVLKAQGYTPMDLTRVYLTAYLGIGAAFVPLGLLGGRLASHAVTSLLLRSMGAAAPDGGYGLRALATFVVLEAAIAATVWTASGVARRLPPIEAIRGSPSGDAVVRRPRSLRLALGVPAALALRTLFLPRRRALFLAGAVAVTAAVAAFSVNVVHTFSQMGAQLPLWGFDDADVRVVRRPARARVEHATLLAQLSARPGVRAVLPADPLVEGAVPARDGRPARALLGVAALGSYEAAGYQTLEGHSPANDGEVALALNTALDYRAKVGDRFDLVLRGQRVPFTVSGIYQSISNLGQGFRIRTGALQAVDPLHQPSQYAVVLEPGVERGAFVRALQADYGEAIQAEAGDRFLAGPIGAIASAMSAAFAFAVALFLLATCAFVGSTTVMDLRERRRAFGVLKAAGMSPAELRSVPVLRSTLLALIGVGVGLVAWGATTRLLLTAAFSGLGLSTFPLTVSAWGTALAVGAIPLGCALTARVAAGVIAEIGVHTLVED